MRKNLLLVTLIGFCLLVACNPNLPDPSPNEQEVTQTQTTPPTISPVLTLTPSQTPTNIPTIPPTITPSATPKGDQEVTLMAVGDIMLGRTIGEMIGSEGLETPFRAPVAAGESLAYAGFDLLNLANNHVLDYGVDALEDTITILTSNKIQTVGAGMDDSEAYAPVFIEIDSLRIAFLAYADIPPTDYDYHAWEAGDSKPGIAWAIEDKIRSGVQAAKTQAGVVIVLFHNGYEIKQQVVDMQKKVAHLAIDNGASLVIGSHPHVLQRIEEYEDGLIVYSMGHFVFDNFLFPPNYSAILNVVLSPEGVSSYEMIDVIVQLNGVPQIMPYDLGD